MFPIGSSHNNQTGIGDSSQKELIPQQEGDIEAVKKSKICIGLNKVKLPKNTVASITIVTTQLVRNFVVRKSKQ